jgi:hypothetical protein
MNREQKRQRIKAAKQEFKKPVTKFEQINLSIASYVPKGMTRAFRNTRFTVMVYDNHKTDRGKAVCALIQKHDDTPIINHWRQIQNIKNEIFGEETTAVEYYPAQSNLMDDHNIYWIWIFPNNDLPIPIL